MATYSQLVCPTMAAGHKRPRQSVAVNGSTSPDRQDVHQWAGDKTDNGGHDEKWAVHLLLRLKSTDSARSSSDDEDHQQQSYEGEESNHSFVDDDSDDSTIATPARRSARKRRSQSHMLDFVWDDDHEDDADDEASSPAKRLRRIMPVESESEHERHQSEADNEPSEPSESDEHEGDDEQPEDEDFSEGDEYIDPSLHRRHRAPTLHSNNNEGSSLSQPSPSTTLVSVKSEPVSSTLRTGALPLPSLLSSAPPSPASSTSSAVASPSVSVAASCAASPATTPVKRTRKPKYSAALEARWEEKFEWLMAYRRAKGNCRVAEGNKEYPGLGKWLSNQKTLCKKGKLKAERMQRLIDVGAIVDPALKAASGSARGSRQHMSSPSPMSLSSSAPSSPMSASGSASPILVNRSVATVDSSARCDDGALTKRRRRSDHPASAMELCACQDKPGGSSQLPPGVGLFSAASPFRTFQGKPILPSLGFPPQTHHSHAHSAAGGSTSFRPFPLAMPPVLFASYSH